MIAFIVVPIKLHRNLIESCVQKNRGFVIDILNE